jgi:hypothetical protein
MFSALDLRGNDQVACYDDGVGTSTFKPLALLGGAFGIGLRRNVISLYKFACRNYRSPNDEIFGFGFSRGAFTIRVVIGLIIDQGLIPTANLTEAQFDRLARSAYRDYHKWHFHTNWGLIVKQIKNWLGIAPPPRSAPPMGRNIPVIRFLGLWDTVAAYGLPIGEMTRGVSQWLWPLEIPSHTLHPNVKRACHALSLDDERTTFHPVLWDETGELPTTNTFTSGERLTQVWFAGVHANVGGGYPDDSLAQIPLYWIMQEARACGLVFKKANPNAVAEVQQAQDKDGRLYDSRRGLGSYYRYGPRRLSRLCDELFSRTLNDKVSVLRPKIHESAFMRIGNRAHVYAPIGIPHDYELVVTVSNANGVDADFRIDPLPKAAPPGAPRVYELEQDAQARVFAERAAIWPLVYFRAALYLATLAATAFLVAFPFTGRSNDIQSRENALRWVSEAIQAIGAFFPGWASPWFGGWAQYPVIFLVLAITLAILLFASSRIAALITDRMTGLWRESLNHIRPAPPAPPSNVLTTRERILVGLRSTWRDYLGPALSAIAILYFGLTLSDRWTFTALDEAGFVCENTAYGDLKPIPFEGVLFSFDVRNSCFATGYKVERLDRYLIWTSPNRSDLDNEYKGYQDETKSSCSPAPDGHLFNGGVETDARGYETFRPNKIKALTYWQIVWNVVLLPVKRHYGEPWFQPVARYGYLGSELDFLEPDPNPDVKKISEVVVPRVSGQLFFYFNDAVVAAPDWPEAQAFYWDNHGCATFFVKPADRNSAG